MNLVDGVDAAAAGWGHSRQHLGGADFFGGPFTLSVARRASSGHARSALNTESWN
jgi:hypothetical protein